jgi:hypothetical protein
MINGNCKYNKLSLTASGHITVKTAKFFIAIEKLDFFESKSITTG